jgi:hypothetical protein
MHYFLMDIYAKNVCLVLHLNGTSKNGLENCPFLRGIIISAVITPIVVLYTTRKDLSVLGISI